MSGKLPLYQGISVSSPWGTDANVGLYWSKFLRSYEPGKNSGDEANWKTEAVREAANRVVGTKARLDEANQRLSGLIAQRGGFELMLVSRTSFVTGLGIEHPLENGFSWHFTLGTPYLPGSSLKGLARSWATTWSAGTDQTDVDRIFGPAAEASEKSAGSVVFLDAIPSAPPTLHADIINPHYGSYYKPGNTKDPPADWHSPVPVPLLTVASGLHLHGGVLPRRPASQQDRADAEAAREWLVLAFDRLGAGAKTAKGYGRFEVDKDALKQAENVNQRRQEELAAKREFASRTAGKTAIFVEFLADSLEHDFDGTKDYFMSTGFRAWLERLEADPDPDVCMELERLVRKHFKPGLLDNPDDGSYKSNQVGLARRFLNVKAELGL